MPLFSVWTETEAREKGQSLRCCWYKSFLSTSTKLLPYQSWSSATNKQQPLGPELYSLNSSGIVLHKALTVCGVGQLESAGVGAVLLCQQPCWDMFQAPGVLATTDVQRGPEMCVQISCPTLLNRLRRWPRMLCAARKDKTNMVNQKQVKKQCFKWSKTWNYSPVVS